MHDITLVCVPRDRRVECLIFDDDQGFAFRQCIYQARKSGFAGGILPNIKPFAF